MYTKKDFESLVDRREELVAALESNYEELKSACFDVLLNEEESRTYLANRWGIGRVTLNNHMYDLEEERGIALPIPPKANKR